MVLVSGTSVMELTDISLLDTTARAYQLMTAWHYTNRKMMIIIIVIIITVQHHTNRDHRRQLSSMHLSLAM